MTLQAEVERLREKVALIKLGAYMDDDGELPPYWQVIVDNLEHDIARAEEWMEATR